MRHLLAAGLLAGFALPQAARADFSIQAAPPTFQEDAAPLDQQRTARPVPRRPPGASRTGIAVGFGDEVPLAFAVRQIVPSGVSVRYGPGTGEAGLVSWRGGAPWPEVLQAAVRPLGLSALVRPGAVEIRIAAR